MPFVILNSSLHLLHIMNRLFTFITFLLFATAKIVAQNDTTIYQVTEKRASFPGCNWDWYTEQQKDSCRQYAMSDFLRATLRYPAAARDSNISGRVVLQFVVEKNGFLTNIKTMKGVGGGCTEEAKRIVNAMNELEIRWVPGEIAQKQVRSIFTLPISFKLQEDPGFSYVDGLPVFYLFDKPASYKEGEESLNIFLKNNLVIPKTLNDSCKAGVIQAELLVHPNGLVKALQIDDFSNLGFDAQFEAIQVLGKTINKWNPAIYKEKTVPTTQNVRVIFKPNASKCKATAANFETAYAKINEGIALSDKKEWDASLQKFGEAIKLLPNNMEAYYLRGFVHMNTQKNAEACADFTKVKANMNVNWVDNILPLLCR
jgi:tetratricopeptide (TPR) repeat protein